MDVVTLQAAKTASLRQQLHRNPASVWAIGDSITRNGVTDPTGAADLIISTQSYLYWACLLSNGRLQYGGTAATGGFNTTQIIATHLPTVLAARPSYCVVHAGTNDNGAITQAQSIANLKSIYDQLLAAGIVPVATTMLPKQTLLGNNAAILTKLNMWITRYAQQRNFPVVDWHSLFVSPTDGNWTGYAVPGTWNQDSTHPNGAGAKAMGQALVDKLLPWLPPSSLYLPTVNVQGQTTFHPTDSNALFLTDTNTDGTPDTLTSSAGTGVTYSTSAMAANEGLGNWFNLTKAGAGNPFVQGSTAATTAGNRMLFTCKVKTSGVKTGGATWHVRLTDGNTIDVFALRAMTEDIALGLIYREFTMPSGTSGAMKFVPMLDSGNAVLSVGQVGLYDLTAAGLYP